MKGPNSFTFCAQIFSLTIFFISDKVMGIDKDRNAQLNDIFTYFLINKLIIKDGKIRFLCVKNVLKTFSICPSSIPMFWGKLIQCTIAAMNFP